ncbi:alpha/beta hydrolase [Pasteurella testudinis]|uniref:alpha/beta hydrolase n=1 Tax=Pasteurella testudinis TaxID=761 RepID=UPI0040598639
MISIKQFAYLFYGFLISMITFATEAQSAVLSADALFDIKQHDRTFNAQNYRLFIAVPKQHNNGNVLYLLDGNTHFPLALQAIDPVLPLPTIIAVGYPTQEAYAVAERTRDYTFAAQGEEFVYGGGAADFLTFISGLPHFLAQDYAVNAQRSLFFGHSFGGLFGLYVLLNQPQLFDDYILASPSLWWGNGTLLQQRNVEFHRIRPSSLLFTLGEYEANPLADPDQNSARIQRIFNRRNVLKIEDLQQQLAEKGVNGDFILLEKHNHGSSAAPALNMAVQKAQQSAP